MTREEYIIDDDHIELDPTFHQESEEDVCDCFKSPEEDEKQCFEMMNVWIKSETSNPPDLFFYFNFEIF